MSSWVIAKTPITDPYPCRCGESRGRRCNPKWCPCAGRLDYTEDCCARYNTPETVAKAWWLG